MDVEVPFLYEKKKRKEKYIPLTLNMWTEVGVIFTIAQCHNENQEANHCHGEFDPRKHLFFPVRYKKINEVISNIQH